MKKLLPILLGLALAFAPAAFAQNITKSLQGAQDPRGPVGIDTSNSAYFPGHIDTSAPASQIPTTSTCFTGTVSAGSYDNGGTLTTGGGTTCQLIFGVPFNVQPHCVFNSRTSAITSTPTYTDALSGVNMTVVASSNVYDWVCLGN